MYFYFIFNLSHVWSRIEILELYKLKPKHFTSMEEAFKAADALVAKQKAEMPSIEEQYPAMLFPNMPSLDQFYYVNSSGTLAAYTQLS